MDRDDARTPTFDGALRVAHHFPRPFFESWEEVAKKTLKGRPSSSLDAGTYEALAVKPLYSADDVPLDLPPIGDLRRHAIEIACPIDLRDPTGTTGRIVEALDDGADALWIWVDRRSSTWGRLTAGAIALFQEAADGAPIYLDARGAASAMAALLIASSRRLDTGFETLAGGLDIDPLGVLAADGRLPGSLAGSLEHLSEALRWCEDHAPRLRAVAVSTLPHVKGGATAVQELAISLASGVAYLRAMEQRNITPDQVCRRLRFVTAVGRDLFMEVAKIRALRVLWRRVTAACGISGDEAAAPIHVITSPRCLTVRDPWVNLLRGTVGAYAAVVGGADVVTVLPFDSVAGTSDAFARRLAVSTVSILREECHIDHVRDPAAGSYLVEKLTSDLCTAAWDEFQRVEGTGGMVNYLRSGALARELADALAAKRRGVATLKDPITGVSSFPDLEEEPVHRRRSSRDPRLSPDDEATDPHRAVGSEYGTFAAALESAHGGVNAAELIEVLQGSDMNELLTPVVMEREATPFEALRDASDRHLVEAGSRPRVFVAVVGSTSGNRAIVNSVTNLLAAGGIIAVLGENTDDSQALTAAFTASGSRAAVICASSDRDAEAISMLASEFKALRARRVLVTGRPGRLENAWREAGVDGFIHRAVDAVHLLADLLEAEGVKRG